MSNRELKHWSLSTYRRLFIFFGAVGAIAVLAGIVYEALLTAFLLSLIFTYLTSPMVNWLERKSRLSRDKLVVILMILMAAGLGLFLVNFLPIFYRELVVMFRMIPEAGVSLMERLAPVRDYLVQSGLLKPGIFETWVRELDVFEQMSVEMKGLVHRLWTQAPDLLGGAINLVITPVMVYFLLTETPHIRRGIRGLVPPDLLPHLRVLIRLMDQKLRAVVKGQVTVALLLGIFYAFGLNLVGFESAMAIGAIAGLCRFVPYLDVIVGLSLTFVVLVTQKAPMAQFMGASLVFLVVQVIDGMVITPRVMGQRAGIHPGVTIISVIALGHWFGFFGVLLAVPVVAMAYVLIELGISYYRVGAFFNKGVERTDLALHGEAKLVVAATGTTGEAASSVLPSDGA